MVIVMYRELPMLPTLFPTSTFGLTLPETAKHCGLSRRRPRFKSITWYCFCLSAVT